MSDINVVHMSEEDAVKLALFLKHYDKINVLIKAGFFEQKKANIIVNIDHTGKIQNIKREDFLYSASFDKL
jgi:hypothetical protein